MKSKERKGDKKMPMHRPVQISPLASFLALVTLFFFALLVTKENSILNFFYFSKKEITMPRMAGFVCTPTNFIMKKCWE